MKFKVIYFALSYLLNTKEHGFVQFKTHALMAHALMANKFPSINLERFLIGLYLHLDVKTTIPFEYYQKFRKFK